MAWGVAVTRQFVNIIIEKSWFSLCLWWDRFCRIKKGLNYFIPVLLTIYNKHDIWLFGRVEFQWELLGKCQGFGDHVVFLSKYSFHVRFRWWHVITEWPTWERDISLYKWSNKRNILIVQGNWKCQWRLRTWTCVISYIYIYVYIYEIILNSCEMFIKQYIYILYRTYGATLSVCQIVGAVFKVSCYLLILIWHWMVIGSLHTVVKWRMARILGH